MLIQFFLVDYIDLFLNAEPDLPSLDKSCMAVMWSFFNTMLDLDLLIFCWGLGFIVFIFMRDIASRVFLYLSVLSIRIMQVSQNDLGNVPLLFSGRDCRINITSSLKVQ